MSLEAVGDYVLVAPLKEETSAGGIVLSGNDDDKVGKGILESKGGCHFPEVEVGQTVLYIVKDSIPSRIEGREVVWVASMDILAVEDK